MKSVVISGASQRLGLTLVGQFLSQGWKVYAITRTPSEVLKALDDSGALSIIAVGEYTEASIKNAIDEIVSSGASLNALIHNASVFHMDADEFSNQDFLSFYSMHMAIPAQLNMGLRNCLYNEETPGNIIHITDIYSENPNPEFALYCASKAGAENLMKGFAKKFAPGIRVNSIQPGPIQFLPSHSEEAKQRVLSETPLNKEGGFEPVVQAAMSIIDNSYMTGASIKVDGGRSLGRR